MCRLYGFRATHPTRVQCELVDAQNSLIRQSRRDARGLENVDGWGLGLVRAGQVECARQVEPAFESEEFRRDAAASEATTAIAHVRRATVGEPRPENTHPFRHDGSLFAHNGHVPGFGEIRSRFLMAMTPGLRESLRGDTDSEHLFNLLLTRLEELEDRSRGDARAPGGGRRPGGETTERSGARAPGGPPAALAMRGVLRETLREIDEWSEETVPDAGESRRGPEAVTPRRGSEGEGTPRAALNVLWTVGDRLAGSRLGRSLWYVERDGAHRCEVCGEPHPEPEPEGYRALVVASERITGEEWREVPEGSVFHVDGEMRLRTTSLG